MATETRAIISLAVAHRWVSSVGNYVERFEHACLARAGTRHALATVNGTSALHIALLLAGVRPDDEVVVPTLTFIATANAVRYADAWPLCIDAEPDHWQMAKLMDCGLSDKEMDMILRLNAQRVLLKAKSCNQQT